MNKKKKIVVMQAMRRIFTRRGHNDVGLKSIIDPGGTEALWKEKGNLQKRVSATR